MKISASFKDRDTVTFTEQEKAIPVLPVQQRGVGRWQAQESHRY